MLPFLVVVPLMTAMARSVASLLLLAFGLGLLMGPHPCAASHPRPEPESAPGSCHDTQPSPAAGQEQHGEDCGDFCQHACHMTAIAEAEPVVFAFSPVSETFAEPPGSGRPLCGLPIDHIPLA